MERTPLNKTTLIVLALLMLLPLAAGTAVADEDTGWELGGLACAGAMCAFPVVWFIIWLLVAI